MDLVLAGAMRRERERRAWRQVDLGSRLDWPPSRVTRIENGQQRFLIEDLLGLCRVLEISLSDLLIDADDADRLALGLVSGKSAGSQP